jgi:hypothetical protein
MVHDMRWPADNLVCSTKNESLCSVWSWLYSTLLALPAHAHQIQSSPASMRVISLPCHYTVCYCAHDSETIQAYLAPPADMLLRMEPQQWVTHTCCRRCLQMRIKIALRTNVEACPPLIFFKGPLQYGSQRKQILLRSTTTLFQYHDLVWNTQAALLYLEIHSAGMTTAKGCRFILPMHVLMPRYHNQAWQMICTPTSYCTQRCKAQTHCLSYYVQFARTQGT